MPGGPFDSSRTRVAPFFDQLHARDPFGQSWLPPLLALPTFGSDTPRPRATSPLREYGWGETERALAAPATLLEWLVQNVKAPPGTTEASVGPERWGLVRRDPDRVDAALAALGSGSRGRAWYVFEGPSYPDAYLATDDLVVVIEGKRTEPGPTTSTTWMPVRHQMLRHLDAALDTLDGRALLGFFMVEGDGEDAIPPVWRDACRDTLIPAAIDGSLPHRSEAERRIIRDAFLGVATWQRACQALDVPFASLPDRVDD
jgi:hypothetical protein